MGKSYSALPTDERDLRNPDSYFLPKINFAVLIEIQSYNRPVAGLGDAGGSIKDPSAIGSVQGR
jgi:hypothetical protein